MLGKGRLLIKHLKVKTVLFKCSQLNDTEIVEKMFFLFQTVQFKSLFVSKTKLGVQLECFVIVSLKKF